MKTKTKLTHVMIGTGSWGLWVGEIVATKRALADVVETKAVHVTRCRNVRFWYGPTGGITSLAAEGPNAADKRNRIGAPVDALVTDVRVIYYLSAKAIANFAAVRS